MRKRTPFRNGALEVAKHEQQKALLRQQVARREQQQHLLPAELLQQDGDDRTARSPSTRHVSASRSSGTVCQADESLGDHRRELTPSGGSGRTEPLGRYITELGLQQHQVFNEAGSELLWRLDILG